VLIVRATNKLLRRIGSPTLQGGEHSTTLYYSPGFVIIPLRDPGRWMADPV
jgi:hypothetical protein